MYCTNGGYSWHYVRVQGRYISPIIHSRPHSQNSCIFVDLACFMMRGSTEARKLHVGVPVQFSKVVCFVLYWVQFSNARHVQVHVLGLYCCKSLNYCQPIYHQSRCKQLPMKSPFSGCSRHASIPASFTRGMNCVDRYRSRCDSRPGTCICTSADSDIPNMK